MQWTHYIDVLIENQTLERKLLQTNKKVNFAFSHTKTGSCQNGGLVSAETFEFLIVTSFKILHLPESVCFCAVWKTVIILSILHELGCGKLVLRSSRVLPTSSHSFSSGNDYLFTRANTIGSEDFIGNL